MINNLTIGIITFNEVENLRKNLFNFVNFPVIIVDSISLDGTREFVSQFDNVIFIENKFEGYASQRNFLLKNVTTKYVLFLDADEWMCADQIQQLSDKLSNLDIVAGLFRRKEILNGVWLKRSMQYPLYFPRLFDVSKVEIKREINEEYHFSGASVKFEFHITHDFMSKGYIDWRSKQSSYALKEADINYSKYEGSNFRSFVKYISNKYYLNPIIIFIYLFFIKLCFLEGRVGVFMGLNRVLYETQIVLYKISRLFKL